MADLILRDRVKETSTTTGTGLLTLAGALEGFRTFSAALGGTAHVTYLISMAAEWEVGRGTYTSGGNTLARDSVYASSNAGALVNFSAGTKEVSIVQPALIMPVARFAGAYQPPKVLASYDGMAWGGNAAAGQYSLAVGFDADAGYATPGAYCLALGWGAKAYGGSSIAIGPGAETIGAAQYSEARGYWAKARQPAQRVVCQHDTFTKGHSARIESEVGALTTNATPTEMLAMLGNRVKLGPGTAWAWTVMLAAFRDSNGTAWAKKFEGLLKQNSSGTTSMVGTPVETLLGDDFAGALSAAVTADNANGALKVTVTGIAGATIRWHANIQVAAVSFY